MVFDAGTGIIGLGRALMQRAQRRVVHIFLSHAHHDHIEGLRFFPPVYQPGWKCHLYARRKARVERLLARMMAPNLFPVSLDELPAQLTFEDLADDAHIRLRGQPDVEIQARFSRAHTKVGVMLYRVSCGGRSLVYATDVEAPMGGHQDVVDFARGADVLIHDAQYSEEEYFGAAHKQGWGHSTVAMAATAARDAEVGKLILYHHDPTHDDRKVKALQAQARKVFRNSTAASEGMEVRLG